jgi:membrane-bound metal-dependent hydrolase YbcI (DUF457 family)
MPDLLTHALLAYVLCTVLSWRYGWLSPGYVTVGMAGAFVPDLAKATILVPSPRVVAALDAPFSWYGVHTLGGAFVATLVGVVLVPPAERRRVFALLSLGAGSHLVADALLRWATGRSYALLWPLSGWAPPTPGLYSSADVWPSLAAGLLALTVWRLDVRWHRQVDRGDAG